jgi:YD repeat-containing protein
MLRHAICSLAICSSLFASSPSSPSVVVDGDLVYVYTYGSGELMETKTTYDRGYLFSEEHFEYDGCGDVPFYSYSDDALSLVTRTDWLEDARTLTERVSEYYVEDGVEKFIKTTTTQYNTFDDPISITTSYGDGTLSSFEHSEWDHGRLISKESSEGLYNYAYDDLGRLIREEQPGGILIEWGYDDTVERVKRTENGLSSHWEYDIDTGAISYYSDFLGRAYFYDSNEEGDIVRVVYPPIRTEDGWICPEYSCKRDELGRVGEETDAMGRVWRLEYDDQDQVVAAYYDDHSVGYERDGFGRILTERHFSSDGDLLFEEEYTYSGRLCTSGKGSVYTYDAQGRPIKEETAQGVKTMAYDPRGLRISECTDERCTFWEYDNCERVVMASIQLSDGTPLRTWHIEYDDAGRMVRRTFEDEGCRHESYFDCWGRIAQDIDQDGRITTIEYDDGYQFEGQPACRKVVAGSDGSITTSTFDGDQRLLREEVRDASGTLKSKKDLFYDLDGQLAKSC